MHAENKFANKKTFNYYHYYYYYYHYHHYYHYYYHYYCDYYYCYYYYCCYCYCYYCYYYCCCHYYHVDMAGTDDMDGTPSGHRPQLTRSFTDVRSFTEGGLLALRSPGSRSPPQHGHLVITPLAAPQLAPCASSARAWRLWAARYSQSEAQPLGRPATASGGRSEPPPRSLISLLLTF